MEDNNLFETIDRAKGWIQSLTVFGKTYKADHYAIVENPPGHPRGSFKVVMWNDDPQERTPEETYAREWIYEPIKLRGEKWLSVQRGTYYISDIMKQDWEGRHILPEINEGIKVSIKPYTNFIPPDETLIRHGVWVSEALNAEYEQEEMHNYKESI